MNKTAMHGVYIAMHGRAFLGLCILHKKDTYFLDVRTFSMHKRFLLRIDTAFSGKKVRIKCVTSAQRYV